jgi:hypothetical protein
MGSVNSGEYPMLALRPEVSVDRKNLKCEKAKVLQERRVIWKRLNPVSFGFSSERRENLIHPTFASKDTQG